MKRLRLLLHPPEKVFAWAIIAALVLLFCSVATVRAADPLNDQPNWVVGQFPSGTPATVTVDVVQIETGTTVADDAAATQLQIDSADSIYWRYDLSTVSGYPTGCEVATYAVAFEPAGGDCSEGGTPANCFFVMRQVGGSECFATAISTYYVHTSTIVSGQGIDQAVLDFYAARSVLPLLWVETSRSESEDYTAPDSNYWEVYFYTSSASAPRILCTVITTTNPSSSLPSYTHCS